MATINVSCRFCNKTHAVKKHGKGKAGHQRYKYYDYCRSFQLSYEYKAWQKGIKDTICDMAMNGSGIRDTARVLKIGCSRVLRVLKNSAINK